MSARQKLTKEERLLVRAQWRWVWRRYLPLHGRVFGWSRGRQWRFQWRLRRAGRRASVAELTVLMQAGWREQQAAVWMIAAGRRADLRPEIERILLGNGWTHSRWQCCVALAALGTEADARLLIAYLDQTLSLPLEEEGSVTHCQPEALAALLHLDEQLGTTHARRFLGPDGPWARWPGSAEVSFADERDNLRRYLIFAEGGDPGFRQRRKSS
jgi:hypothetical protein